MSVTVLYFAALRDAAGVNEEQLPRPESLPELYAVLCERYGFKHAQNQLRVACNGAFCDWQYVPLDGDVIAFIPPVSGG
jgi:molybdopterin synthase sulfur carrier subunit